MISKILIPTDGTRASKKAIDYAIGLAKQTKASITILGVVDKSAFLAQSIPASVSSNQMITPIEDYLSRLTDSFIDQAVRQCRKKGVKPTTVVRSGHPVEEIVKEARRSKASLIVVGSHGKGALESAVLGSVTYGLIHNNTKYPVLVIRG
ncbi:MAG: universal stress protein [Nitrospiraceae bacterium]|nr:MAG: universal stress protein [Nitrospiraceae bacterium]